MDELYEIERQLVELEPHATGKTRAMLFAALRDIQATRMERVAAALADLGHAAEARQAETTARIAHAGAWKDLPAPTGGPTP